MKGQFDQNNSRLMYIEPPHLHDPSHVSSVASLPSSTLESLPLTVQSVLYNLQQPASVIYASLLRFQDLLSDRFDRLNPSLDDDGEYTFSEPSFMTYTNALTAERGYMVSGARTDWRHKLSLARVAIQPYANANVNVQITPSHSSSITLTTWLNDLESEVQSWCEYARAIHVPDYEDTIAEFLAMSKTEPSLTTETETDDSDLEYADDASPLDSPAMSLSLATPTLENLKDVAAVEICEIRERDFALAGFDEVVPDEKKGFGVVTSSPGFDLEGQRG